MKLWPGDIIVDQHGEAESQEGIMLAITSTLIIESMECFAKPCQIHQLHRRGLQCQTAKDRIAPRPKCEFDVYRLSLWERFTPDEALAFEVYARGMIRDLPPLAVMPSAVAIARILMHFGKLQRYAAEFTLVSTLISDLVVTGVYECLSAPHKDEVLSIPAAQAA